MLERWGERVRADVLTSGGLVAAIDTNIEVPDGCEVVDAGGCLLTPGFVDLLADLGGPDDLERETPATGSAEAALGGFTTVLVTSTAAAPIDSAAALAARQALDPGLIRLHYAASVTRAHAGTTLAPMAELAAAGVRWFTDVVSSCADTDLLRNAFDYASGLGVEVGFALPVEDPSFARDGVMHEGPTAARMGVPSRPEIAERMGAERLLALAELTGAQLLLGPFSSKAALECVELRRSAARIEDRVHTHLTPAHLVFTDRDCAGYDTARRFDPPLRADTLGDWLMAGYGDAISSGHRPHPAQHDELPFDQAPAGGSSLGSAVAVTATADTGGESIPLEDVVHRMASVPAKLVGGSTPGRLLVGGAADICVVDPAADWTIPNRPGASLAATTPFAGIQCHSGVRHTIVNGQAVVLEGELVAAGGVIQKGEQ